MPAVSFSDAAAYLGHSSRSTLYQLRDENLLSDYLRPGGRGGSQLLELSPPDLPSLRQHVERSVRLQINAAGPRKIDHSSRGRVDRRWGVVAGLLGQALADVGGLTLTAAEAAAVAEQAVSAPTVRLLSSRSQVRILKGACRSRTDRRCPAPGLPTCAAFDDHQHH